jgi:uncharacterized protein
MPQVQLNVAQIGAPGCFDCNRIKIESKVMGTVVAALLVAFLLYAAFALAMYRGQHRLVYRMDPRRVSPARLGLANVDEVDLVVPGGETLIAWYGKADPGKPTVLYFHGQAGNLACRGERVRRYRSAGVGLLMVAYRGFSGSTGTPGERVNVEDGVFALDWLAQQGVAASNVVIYGESLGTGIAVQVAAKRVVSGLVLDSPFTTLADVAARRHPLLPVRQFMFDRYETIVHAGKIATPALILHGEEDHIVPMSMGKDVFEALTGPKRLITYAGGRHLDHGKFGSFDAVLRFMHERKRLPGGYRKVERVERPYNAPAAIPAALPARA